MPDNETRATQGTVHRADWFVLALLAISITGNVAFGIAFFRLSSRVTAPTSASAPPSGPAVGTLLPDIDAQRLQGGREKIVFSADKRPTLVYVFTPSCQWCSKNLDNLRVLLAAAKNSHRIVGLSLDPDVEQYVEQSRLDMPVYIHPSKATTAAFQLGPTPQTLVVSSEGKLLKSWLGAYGGNTKAAVEEYFSTTLPGLSREGTVSSR